MTRAVRVEGGLLARNSVLNLAGQLVPLGVAVLASPFIVRGLGDDRFGILAIAWIVLGSFGLFDLGLGRATTRFVAEALGRGDASLVPTLVWNAVLVQAAFGVVGGATLLGVAPALAHRVLTIPVELEAETVRCFVLLSAAVPAVLVSGTFRGALEAAQRFDLVNAVQVPANVASYLLPLAGLGLGLDLAGIVALLLAARVTGMAGFALLCARVFPGLARPRRVQSDVLRRLLGFGGWIMASSVTIPILTYLERVLIASLIAASALTYYAVPLEVIGRVSVLPASLALTLFPAFSALQASHPDRLGGLASRATKYVLACATPVLLLLFVFAPGLLSVWIGPEFAERSATAMRLLAVGAGLNALAHVPLAAVQGLGRPDLKVKLDLVEITVFFALAWWLIPGWGIVGAAWAKLGVTVLDLAGLTWLSRRAGGWAVRDLLDAGLVRGIAWTAGFAAVAPGLALIEPPAAWGAAVFAAAAAAYGAGFWRHATDAAEREAILGLARRLRVGRAAA